MWRIYLRDPVTSWEVLLIDNLTLTWEPPTVGTTWGGLFVVTHVEMQRPGEQDGVVYIHPIANLCTREFGDWEIRFRDPQTGKKWDLFQGYSSLWQPRETAFGPFVVTQIVQGETPVVTIEPIQDLLVTVTDES